MLSRSNASYLRMGVIHYADAGYDKAIEFAEKTT
jgi:urocanate hydratase